MTDEQYNQILAAIADRANKRMVGLMFSTVACVLAMFGLLIAKK